MIVVSDSTPLISLMKADRLELLHLLFGEILIPDAVFDELTANDHYTEEAELIRSSSYIRQVSIEDTKAVSLLQRATGLDLGESEAIIYADNNKADLLLMDEASGRKVAMSMGLEIMGTVGVLVNACRDGYLRPEEVDEALAIMKRANIRISDRLIRNALEIVYSINEGDREGSR